MAFSIASISSSDNLGLATIRIFPPFSKNTSNPLANNLKLSLVK